MAFVPRFEIRSKYQKKNYEYFEPDYIDVQCGRCKSVFEFDPRWSKYEEADDGKESAVAFCVYCGRKHLVRI